MMNRKAEPVRPLYVLQLLGVLMVLGGASGFVPRSASVRRRLQRLDAVTARDRTGGKANASSVATRRQKTPQPSSPQQQQKPWLADLITSWFHLPPAKLSSPSGSSRAKATNRRHSSARDGIRAEILQLRASNAELREEVGTLRRSMVERGYIPVEDVFAVITKAASSAAGGYESGKEDPLRSNNKPPPPPPPPPAKLPREARLAALVVLYGAAVAFGGVFVPIAIGVGASRSLRWLDEGGTLMPRRWRTGDGGGGRGQKPWGATGPRRRGRGRWKDAVLSYVPVVARLRGEGEAGVDVGGGAGGAAERDAWDSMYPPRR